MKTEGCTLSWLGGRRLRAGLAGSLRLAAGV